MGRQIRLLLTLEDADNLFATFHKGCHSGVVHARSPNPRPRVLNSVTFQEAGQPWLFYYLVNPEDVDSITMREVPAQGYWVVDSLRSPVIEFTKSFCDNKSIRAGRLWYDVKYYEGDNLLQKSQSFQSWASQIFKVARNTLTKRDNYFLGAQAEHLINSRTLQIIK
jgi:hypothetical protein